MRYLTFTVVGILLLAPATVHAQYDYDRDYLDPGAYDDYPTYYGYYSSTPQEGYGRGIADIIRSQGIYNQQTAEALVTGEEARRKYIQNYREGVETYLQTRELSRQYRSAEHAARRESVRRRLANRKPYQPDRLSPGELNRSTGEIRWPMVLRKSVYADQRASVERTFDQWAARGDDFDVNGYETVLASGEAMLSTLKERIRDIPSSDYLAAKRFIQGLLNEAEFPVTRDLVGSSNGVARRASENSPERQLAGP